MRKATVQEVPENLNAIIPVLLFLQTLSRGEVLALHRIAQKISIYSVESPTKGAKP